MATPTMSAPSVGNAPLAPASNDPVSLDTPHPRILIVEDDEDIQRILQLAFKHMRGLRTHICGDSRLALEMAREVAPDLILLDYLMPHLDGQAVFGQLKADSDLAQIPVVFLTASATSVEVTALRQLGAADILFKPFNTRELVDRLFEILRRLKESGPNC